jgi:hypothetical protein
MTTQPSIDTTAIKADSLTSEQFSLLLAMPHDALIALYNTESQRLSHGLEPHQVDETCKPLYIAKLFARLPVRYQMMAIEKSNEAAAMRLPASDEVTERKSTKAERCRENMPLNGTRHFDVMR